MRVVSKFLTADVRITRVAIEGRKVVIEGMVKQMLPMTVELAPADALEMLHAAATPLRRRLADLLPAALAARLAPPDEPPPGGPVA